MSATRPDPSDPARQPAPQDPSAVRLPNWPPRPKPTWPPPDFSQEAFEQRRRERLEEIRRYFEGRTATNRLAADATSAGSPSVPPPAPTLPSAPDRRDAGGTNAGSPGVPPGTPPPAPTLAPAPDRRDAGDTGTPSPEAPAEPKPTPPARAGSPRHTQARKARKRRDPFRNVTLLGETWERFPKGGLPLGLLKDLALALEESVQFRLQTNLGPHYLWPEDSALLWHLSATARHDPRTLKQMSEYDLEVLLGQDMERLVRTRLLPKHAEHELRRDAVLGALIRLGQVYQSCRRKWKKARAREVVWGAVQRVCQAPKRAYQMLEQGKAVEALWKARAAEQQAAQAQALALLGDYVI